MARLFTGYMTVPAGLTGPALGDKTVAGLVLAPDGNPAGAATSVIRAPWSTRARILRVRVQPTDPLGSVYVGIGAPPTTETLTTSLGLPVLGLLRVVTQVSGEAYTANVLEVSAPPGEWLEVQPLIWLGGAYGAADQAANVSVIWREP